MERRSGQPRYLPAEDTYLLKKSVARYGGGSCLEIGFGTGAVLASVAGSFSLAVGTDIMGLEDAKQALEGPVQIVLTDRAKCFRDGSFDLVYFNPPYLPSQTIEDRAVDGGPSGVEVPIAFLEEGLRVLRRGGRILALLSEEGDVSAFLARCSELGLSASQVGERKIFYETLRVFEMSRREEGRES